MFETKGSNEYNVAKSVVKCSARQPAHLVAVAGANAHEVAENVLLDEGAQLARLRLLDVGVDLGPLHGPRAILRRILIKISNGQ